MRKSIIVIFMLLCMIFLLFYFVVNTHLQRDYFAQTQTNIENLIFLNKDLEVYLLDFLDYDNYDNINSKILEIKQELTILNQYTKEFNESELSEQISILDKLMNKKISLIEEIKSYKAILNNSFRIFQKIYDDDVSKNLNHVYTFIMTLNFHSNEKMQKKIKSLKKILPFYTEQNNSFFLKHALVVITYDMEIQKIKQKMQHLKLEELLIKYNNTYKDYSNTVVNRSYFLIFILFLILIILAVIYLLYEYKLIKSNDELFKFKQAVENSDNIIVITDTNETIKYVNAAFTKTTGYTSKEAIGQKPNILKSGKKSEDFYRNMKETIYSGKVWSGEFINVDKFGDLSYEKASIMPVLDNKGNVKEFIAIKLDMTKERLTEQKLKEQDKMLIQQSKMAAMGEMLENIAHQWRQPLSVISTISSGLTMKKMFDEEFEVDELEKSLTNITNTAQHLSQTIENFRNFFKTDKYQSECILNDVYQKSKDLVSSKFNSLEIKVVENIDTSLKMETFEGELIQVLINLLNNAKDALEKLPKNKEKLLFVDIYRNKKILIEITDNGGGISEDIINRIFEPYFTTKHKSKGTGIGLYMSKEIIEKHIDGTLVVENEEYDYEGKKQKGAKFIITLSS